MKAVSYACGHGIIITDAKLPDSYLSMERGLDTLDGQGIYIISAGSPTSAFGRLKATGATGEAVNLVRAACEVDCMIFSVAGSYDVVDSYSVVTAGAAEPESFKGTINMAKGTKDVIDVYTFNISHHKNFDREMDGLSQRTRTGLRM